MPIPGTKSELLFIHAETPMHPGTGSAIGTVDLPVAREKHTSWPLIPASSLKGVLRDRCHSNSRGTDEFLAVFGPEPGDDNPDRKASEHASALSLTDARLLAFPVRSVKGLFAWVTCPAALQRLERDARLAGNEDLKAKAQACLSTNPQPGGKTALSASEQIMLGNNQMVLEEFDYSCQQAADVRALGESLDALLGTGTRLSTHLAVVSDDFFTHYAKFATEVMARIGIDYETKTVRTGALFYEEFLPAGVVFYTMAMACKPHAEKSGGLASGRDVLDYVKKQAGEPAILQIGADATIGKGLCTVSFAEGGNGA